MIPASGGSFGAHQDSENDGDHVCDYGCGVALTQCADSDKNFLCDECGKSVPVVEDFSSMTNWGNGEGVTETDYSYGITDDGQLKIELAAGRLADVSVDSKQTFDGSKKAVIELDMKVDVSTAWDNGFYEAGFVLKNGSAAVVTVSFKFRTLYAQYGSTGKNIDDGLVHRIKIETDPTNATFDLCLDAELVLDDAAYHAGQTTWNSLTFFAKNNSDEKALSAYFDNLKITVQD